MDVLFQRAKSDLCKTVLASIFVELLHLDLTKLIVEASLPIYMYNALRFDATFEVIPNIVGNNSEIYIFFSQNIFLQLHVEMAWQQGRW